MTSIRMPITHQVVHWSHDRFQIFSREDLVARDRGEKVADTSVREAPSALFRVRLGARRHSRFVIRVRKFFRLAFFSFLLEMQDDRSEESATQEIIGSGWIQTRTPM